MNPGIATGANMTVVGMATVFVALLLLAVVITALARVVAAPRPQTTLPATGGAAGGGTPVAASAPQQSDLAPVAVAAWALHRARSVVIARAAEDSEWRRAGRQGLVTRLGTQR